jgi:hypothetical protein
MGARWGTAAIVTAASVSAAAAAIASGAGAAPRTAAGSCPGSTVPAVVDATFVCLSVGGACTPRFGADYAKFGLTCASGHLVKRRAASGPTLADAFLNTKPTDLTSRASAFKVSGPPPVLHLTFRQALQGAHKLSVQVRNATIGASTVVGSTLKSGWQYTYLVLPAAASDSAPGSYRVSISIDGTGRKEIAYSVGKR